MVEALASLGVAAGIAQFAMIGLRATSLICRAYESANGLLDEQQELLQVTRSIQEHCRELHAQDTRGMTHDTKELLRTSHQLAHKLETELKGLRRASEVGCIFKTRQSLRALRKKSKIEAMNQRLLNLRGQVVLELVAAERQSRNRVLARISAFEDNTSRVVEELQSISQRLNALQTSSNRQTNFNDELFDIINHIHLLVAFNSQRQRTESVLRSLHFKQISERLSDVKDAHRDTFQWSLNSDRTSLPTWLSSGQGIYWIEGKAGSGKSTLMKFLTNESKTRELLAEWAGDSPLVIAKHFFWNIGTELQRGLNGLYRTLLFQILRGIPGLIKHICPQRMDENEYKHLESWTADELSSCFQRLSAIEALPTKYCFFIDGLDEFRGSPDELITILNAMAESKDMKLCVSSRPWVEFRQAFGHLSSQLHVHDLTKDDIIRYIQDNLEQSPRYEVLKSVSPEDAGSFQSEIASRADGVFLWVYLVTQSLLRGLQRHDDISILRRRLEEFPTELEEYFKAMLSTIDSVYWSETSQVFSMLSCSKSPLPLRLLTAYNKHHDIVDKFDSHTGESIRQAQHIDAFLEDRFSANNRRVSETGQLYKTLSREAAMGDLLKSIDGTCEHLQRSFKEEKELAERIISRCKDLVHIYETDDASSSRIRVGFLHRSVADFLALPEVETILRERLENGFEPRLALAEGYVNLMLYEIHLTTSHTEAYAPHAEAADQFLLWVLYLAGQLQRQQADAYGKLMFYLMAVVNCRVFLASGYHLQMRTDDDQATSLLRPSKRRVTTINGLLAQLGLMIPSHVQSKLDWDFNHDLASTKLSPPRKLMLHGSVGKELTITLLDSNQLILERLETVNLERLEGILYSKTLSGGWIGSPDADGAWLYCLVHLTATKFKDHPSNLYETCQLLIFSGVPRYVYFDINDSGHPDRHWWSVRESEEGGDYQRIWLNAREKTAQTHPARVSDFVAIDSARVLEQFPGISSRCPNGMEDMFQPTQHWPNLRHSKQQGGIFGALQRGILGLFS
ncbi:Fc.00g027090.m01.CDS01 [Cosmosporella sp. VM-42]